MTERQLDWQRDKKDKWMDTNMKKRVGINQPFANKVCAPEMPTFSSWNEPGSVWWLWWPGWAGEAVLRCLHNPADKRNECKQSCQCLTAPVRGRNMQQSGEESFGSLGTIRDSWCPGDSASFVPELHTPSPACLQVSTGAKHLCQVLLMCLAGKEELSWGFCHTCCCLAPLSGFHGLPSWVIYDVEKG